MLLQRRQVSPSTGNSVLARSCAPSDERNASAASLIGPVETPVLWIGKSPGTILPSIVIPLKASASDASPPCAYVWRNSVGWAGKARAGATGRGLTFFGVLLSGDRVDGGPRYPEPVFGEAAVQRGQGRHLHHAE